MKLSKTHTDTSLSFGFPILDNEFDSDLEDGNNRFLFDDILMHDNDNFDFME